ncbi:MAG: methylated-DNA--[protein]-cysteine S-methyltransferase [Caulobacteraceae bacterium]
MTGYALFSTAIGVCAIAWTDRGVRRVCFPEASEAATRARLLRGAPGVIEMDPPLAIAEAIAGITRLLRDGRADLTGVELDLEGVDAAERAILEAARAIPAGTTVTYGDLAARVGQPNGARAVGAAMARNPCPIVVPCHRVLAAGGGFGGFSAPGGLESKARLLTIERAAIGDAPSLFEDLPVSVRPPNSA